MEGVRCSGEGRPLAKRTYGSNVSYSPFDPKTISENFD